MSVEELKKGVNDLAPHEQEAFAEWLICSINGARNVESLLISAKTRWQDRGQLPPRPDKANIPHPDEVGDRLERLSHKRF